VVAAPACYEMHMTDQSDESNESDAHPEPVIVATYQSVGEAEVAQAKLRAFGVESAIDDDDGGGVIPVDLDPGIQLEVRAVDAEAAAEILTESVVDET